MADHGHREPRNAERVKLVAGVVARRRDFLAGQARINFAGLAILVPGGKGQAGLPVGKIERINLVERIEQHQIADHHRMEAEQADLIFGRAAFGQAECLANDTDIGAKRAAADSTASPDRSKRCASQDRRAAMAVRSNEPPNVGQSVGDGGAGRCSAAVNMLGQQFRIRAFAPADFSCGAGMAAIEIVQFDVAPEPASLRESTPKPAGLARRRDSVACRDRPAIAPAGIGSLGLRRRLWRLSGTRISLAARKSSHSGRPSGVRNSGLIRSQHQRACGEIALLQLDFAEREQCLVGPTAEKQLIDHAAAASPRSRSAIPFVVPTLGQRIDAAAIERPSRRPATRPIASGNIRESGCSGCRRAGSACPPAARSLGAAFRRPRPIAFRRHWL